ncbi:MAG: hypothetical protein ACRDRA_16105 [Pseudonocardiaceae bacterium]
MSSNDERFVVTLYSAAEAARHLDVLVSRSIARWTSSICRRLAATGARPTFFIDRDDDSAPSTAA